MADWRIYIYLMSVPASIFFSILEKITENEGFLSVAFGVLIGLDRIGKREQFVCESNN